MKKLYLIEYFPTFVAGESRNTKVIDLEEEANDIVKDWESKRRKDSDPPPSGHIVSQKYVFSKDGLVVALIHYYEEDL